MAIRTRFLNADGVTRLISLDLGEIPPGNSYASVNGAPKKLHLGNIGTEHIGALTLQLQQSGNDPAHTWALLYADDDGVADLDNPVGVGAPLELGALVVDAVVPFHLDVVVPSAQAGSPHAFSLYAVAVL